MARGNKLLNRLVRVQTTEYQVTADGYAIGVPPGDRLTAGQASGRAVLLLGLTLVAGVAAWLFMADRVGDSADWPGMESNLVGLAGLLVVVGFLITGTFTPVTNAAAGAVYAVAQGVGLAWISVAFDLGSGWLLANLLLATVLTGLAAMAVRRSRWGGLPALIVVPASAAAGLAALAFVNAVTAFAGADKGLFGPGGAPIPWWGWWGMALLSLWTAYSFGVDLRQLDEFAAAGTSTRYRWAAALAITAGPIGIYLWRFSDFRSTSLSDTYDSHGDSGGSDSGSDSGGSSSD